MINRDISESNGFAKLTPEAATLFCMLIPHYTPHGKMRGGPGYIKEVVCPKIPYLTEGMIADCLHDISEWTSVKWFEHDGRMWIHSTNFTTEHQTLKPNKMGEDQFPNYSGIKPESTIPEVEVEVEVKERLNHPPDQPVPETDEVYIAKVRKFYNDLMEAHDAQLVQGTCVSDWKKHYGDVVNVDAAMFAASTWLIENPRNRKKNFKKFYGNWLRNQYTRATQPRTAR